MQPSFLHTCAHSTGSFIGRILPHILITSMMLHGIINVFCKIFDNFFLKKYLFICLAVLDPSCGMWDVDP